MRRVLLILVFLFTTLCANATECSKYLCQICSNESNAKVKVVSYKEFIDEYYQEIDCEQIGAIVYGRGYIKKPKCKRQKITYICLLRCDGSIIWGDIFKQGSDDILQDY